MSETIDEAFLDTCEGVLEAYVPGFLLMDTRKRLKVVNISRPSREELLFEVRDPHQGQDIVGRFRVTVSVERYG